MKFKHLSIILIVLSILLTMSAVSAEDANATDADVLGEAGPDLSLGSADDSMSSNLTAANEDATFVKSSIKTYMNGDTHYVKLLDSNSAPLVGKTVKFTIDGKTKNAVTSKNGVAALKLNVSKGTYDVKYDFSEKGFNPLSDSMSILVITNKTSEIVADSLVICSSGTFTATLTVDGIPLEGRSVGFTINGKTYFKTTDSNGVASLPIGLKKGSYPVTVSYAGETNIVKSSVSSSIIVATNKASKIVADPLVAYSSGNVFTATLTVDGIALEGRSVGFTINGKTYFKTTDSNGVASLPIGLKKGNYPVTVSYAGETNVDKASVSSSILVITTKTSKIVAPAYTHWRVVLSALPSTERPTTEPQIPRALPVRL